MGVPEDQAGPWPTWNAAHQGMRSDTTSRIARGIPLGKCAEDQVGALHRPGMLHFVGSIPSVGVQLLREFVSNRCGVFGTAEWE